MTAAETTDRIAMWPVAVPRAAYLPNRIGELVTSLERDPTARGVARFEAGLVEELELSDALCVWMDWPRRVAWTNAGTLSRRLQDAVPDALGTGRRMVFSNAIVQPVGPAPARSALLIKGAEATVLAPFTVRMVERIASRIGGALDRVAGLHPLMR